MKASLFLAQLSIRLACRLAMLVTLALLPASVSRVQAQYYTLLSTSSYLNVYFNDGSGIIFGTTPYFGGNTVNGEGTPLSSYGPASWLVTGGTAIPGSLGSGNYNSGLQTTINATAQVSYQQNTPTSGSNTISQYYVTPYGTSLLLTNTTYAGIAELRVDWTATYNYTGVTGPVLDYAQLILEGTLHNFSALAGEETATVWSLPNGPYGSGTVLSSGTTTIGPGGDPHFLTAPITTPANLAALAPNATFWGYDITSPFFAPPNGFYGPHLIISSGNSVTLSGFLDVFVDPGSIQVSFPPPIGIATASGLPVVFWPTGLTNFVLESTTNLASGNWVTNNSTVTINNGTNSITINPATTNMFYRLKE